MIRDFDPWRGELCTCPPKYSLQPYTGCSHKCIYCYATSYIRTKNAKPKKKFISRLIRDLKHIDLRRPINMSTSSDPYLPEEHNYRLTRQALEILIPIGAKILITTKGTLIERDVDIIRGGNVAVMITITTLDEGLARIIEPNAPSPSMRLSLIKILSKNNIPVGVRIDPIIPYVNDDKNQLIELVDKVVEYGAQHIVTSTYKAKADNFKRVITAFSELESKLIKLYKSSPEKHSGYLYLRRNLRKKILDPVIGEALRLNITVATCREGFSQYSPSCDGTHLIPMKIKARRPTLTQYLSITGLSR